MKKYLITGLVTLLPVVVTIAILVFLVNFLTKPFIGIVQNFLSHFNLLNKGFLFFSPEQILVYTSKFLILLVLFGFTIVLGMVTRWFFINSLLSIADSLLHKIPVVNTVYKTSQDIIKTLFVSDKNSFKQVVMVPFPGPASYVIGLISRESPKECSNALGEEMFSVLVPTTPNPTTGFLLSYRKKDMIFLDMRPEDAIKYIVSCGVIIPTEQVPNMTNQSLK